MSLSYPNLPGIEVSIADGGLILPDTGTTEGMLVIAPCTKATAPTDPVLARQSTDAITNYGDYTDTSGAVNPLVAAWKAAFEGGNRRTYLMPLLNTDPKAPHGAPADATAALKNQFLNLNNVLFGPLADFTVDNVVLKDVFADMETTTLISTDFTNPDDVTNFPNVAGIVKYAYKVTSTATVTLPLTITVGTNDSIVINDGTIDNTITLAAKVYDGTAGKTLDDLAHDLETDIVGIVSLIKFKVVTDSGKLVILGNKAFTVKAGTPGDASTVLKLPAGAVTGVAVKGRDDRGMIYVGNFAELLKDYCEDQTINHNTIKGFIGVSAPASTSLSDIKANVDRLAALTNQYSGHVSIVSGPELAYVVPGKNGYYYANGVVTYVALVSTLSAESAPTNKAVAGVAGMNYSLSLRQLNQLSGSKYVSFRSKNGGVYVTDAVTTAPDLIVGGQTQPSDFTRLSTLRITHAAINLVRQVADPFVGEPNGMPQHNALNAAIKAGLEAMKSAGAIQDYRFTIVTDRGAGVLGQSNVTLQLVPAFETRKITVSVSLTTRLN